jgi:hypothetical protein
MAVAGDGASAEVYLRWDAVANPRVTRYELFFGEASRWYGDPIATTETTAIVRGLTSRRLYFFAVRACDQAHTCSDFSNEVIGIDGDSDGLFEEFCWLCLPHWGGWRILLDK